MRHPVYRVTGFESVGPRTLCVEFDDATTRVIDFTVGIQSGVVSGDFPKRALRLVLEWLDLHQEELFEDWNLVQAGRPANKIAPLE